MTSEIDTALRFWREGAGVDHPIVEDLFRGLSSSFAELQWGAVAMPEEIRETPVLFLANHQVAIESLLFSFLVSGATSLPVTAVAKAEHESSWVNALFREIGFGGPDSVDPILYFDREQQSSFLELMKEAAGLLAEGRCSLLIHVEGTRSIACRQPVTKLTSVLVDLALRARVPIVPVRFFGGLPVEAAKERLEFPVDFTAQHYGVGEPILPETIEPMLFAERTRFVLDRMNSVGPPLDQEVPGTPDGLLGDRVKGWSQRCGNPFAAVCLSVLEGVSNPHPETKALLQIAEVLCDAGLFDSSSNRVAGFLKWLDVAGRGSRQ